MSRKLTGLWLAALLCTSSYAATLTVTVKDPGQALVAGAAVEVTGADNLAHQQSTDTTGRAAFDRLTAGAYRVAVTKDGFAKWEGSANVSDRPATIAVALSLGVISSSVKVTARRSPLANSDPNYQALRTGRLGNVYQVSNLVLTRDVATFTFRSGSFSFMPPVLDHVTAGVFVGDGNFQLNRMSGSGPVSEDFTAIVVFFSDATFDEVKAHSELIDASPVRHEEELKHVRSVIQTLPNSKLPPGTQLDSTFRLEDIPNYDAEILADLYNGDVGEKMGSFRALIRGKKHPYLHYIVNPHGAMPAFQAAEEVALIDIGADSDNPGLYLAHLASESRPDPKEEKRLIAPEHYKIEAAIGNDTFLGNQPDLSVTCDMTFRALQDGVKMVKTKMFADFQVSRVTWNGNEIPFLEESWRPDKYVYLRMPEALIKGRSYDVRFEYTGGEATRLNNNASFSTVRTWYPTPLGGVSRATYDLTFHIPHAMLLMASGEELWREPQGKWDVSKWKSDVPITQAVFDWMEKGTFKTRLDETTGTRMSVYTADAGRSTGNVFIDMENALRLFTEWFGKPAFETSKLMVTDFSRSLPGIVFVSPLATRSYSSLVAQTGGGSAGSARFRTPVDERFASLLAVQWWGNTITPASYHDRWLTSGLVGFSASVYDAFAKNDDYKLRWDNARNALLTRTSLGVRANDAGSVSTAPLGSATMTLDDAKGAYIIQMLRAIFWTPENGDNDFKAMLRDFVKRFANSQVSTEDFKQVVEQHMKPGMDLDGNHRMDWFFNEWVYGTEVPNYKLEYSFEAGEDKATVIHGRLTQSGVLSSFRMPVPIFGEFAGRKDRLAVVVMTGRSTADFKVTSAERPKQLLLNINHDILSGKDEVILAKR